MANQLVFGRVPARAKTKQRHGKTEVKVLYFGNLFDSTEDSNKVLRSLTEQPVQLAMFAL
jgi:hypothetical protein